MKKAKINLEKKLALKAARLTSLSNGQQHALAGGQPFTMAMSNCPSRCGPACQAN